MTPVFREITCNDIPALCAVRIATRENALSRDELAAHGICEESVRGMLEETHRGWLCEVDGGTVGFAMGNGETGEMWIDFEIKNGLRYMRKRNGSGGL